MINLFKFLLDGGNTTLSRAVVEAIYLGVSAGLIAGLSFVTNNSDLFNPQWVVVSRLALGILANLVNPKVPNS